METNQVKFIHTKQELDWFNKYEKVRQSGRFNMFCTQSRHATGLTEFAYYYVMANYDTLKAQWKPRN